MKQEILTLNEKRNVTLTAYLQELGGEFRDAVRRPAVLILPGGGYQFCSELEADPVAFPYLKAGYHAFILRYSVKEDAVWPNPMEDYEQAMELIRERADEWKLYPDKIAVIGFSAGGHLAACAATMSRNRPNAAILGYAVTMGEIAKGYCHDAPDVISAVDAETCPCFLFAARNDNIVPVENSLKMMEALTQATVSFESHIYAYGPHGFSTADSSVQNPADGICLRIPNWVSDSIGWLRDVLGDFGPEGMTQPACKAHVSGDSDAFLSVDCTIGHLMGNPEARKILEPILSQSHQGNEDMSEIVQRMMLRDILQFGAVPEATVQAIDEQLSVIPNI